MQGEGGGGLTCTPFRMTSCTASAASWMDSNEHDATTVSSGTCCGTHGTSSTRPHSSSRHEATVHSLASR